MRGLPVAPGCPSLTCPHRGGACSDTGCRLHGTTAGSSGTAAFSGSTCGRKHRPSDLQTLPPPPLPRTLLTTSPCPLRHSRHSVLSPSFPEVRLPTTLSLIPYLPPSLLTPQDHHSNSSSAAGCSGVQRPSRAPSVHMAVTASCPAWPGHKGPSSVHPPSAEREWTGHLRGVVGRSCG